MGLFNRARRAADPPAEARASARLSMSSADFYAALGWPQFAKFARSASVEDALSIPAFWAAVNFISGTIAGLPLHLYKQDSKGNRKRGDGPLAAILHDAVNDEVTSFKWRKGFFDSVFTTGRGITFIERNAAGTVVNLWPLDPAKVTVVLENGRTRYEYKDASQKTKVYEAREIIDIAFMMKPDGLTHRGPVSALSKSLGLAVAATEFGSKFFDNGGVPPFAVTGDFRSVQSMERAGTDFQDAVLKTAKDARQALILPQGLEIKSIGVDAEKTQLVELKRFMVEEIARIFSLPPTFLQDLTNGTFSNTEQQDLHFVKHTLKRWVEDFEQELNLKLFGRQNRRWFVELNMDGLLRGDFKGRMEGYSKAIQNAILTPNEARRMENRPDDPKGGELLIQGATVPLGSQPVDKQQPNNDGGTNDGA